MEKSIWKQVLSYAHVLPPLDRQLQGGGVFSGPQSGLTLTTLCHYTSPASTAWLLKSVWPGSDMHLPVDLSPDAPRRRCPFPSWWPYVTPTGCRVIWLKRWPPLLDACCSSVLWCLLESCERPVTWLVTTPPWKEAGECQQSKYPALLIREGSSHCILEPLEEALPSLTTQQDQL